MDSKASVQPFPDDFVWGCATAAYQIEGAHDADGKAPSIWDSFTHLPNKIVNNDTGDVACDHYNRFRDDVKLLQKLGFKAYRFSISWPRLINENRDLTGPVNEAGVKFYSDLIDCLLEHGIQPYVTLYHWDLPDALSSGDPREKSGFLSRTIVPAFTKYAKLCFERFGDRVKHWITFNEPFCICVWGYGMGLHAPGNDHSPGINPYLAAHHLLLAHGETVKLYRQSFQASQGGVIAITLNTEWFESESQDPADLAATHRAISWQFGWFADVVHFGRYPQVMVDALGSRLPTFTQEESKMLAGSTDFFGLNHYSTRMSSRPSIMRQLAMLPSALGELYMSTESVSRTCRITCKLAFGNHYLKDMNANVVAVDTQKTGMGWPIVPWGFKKLLLYIENTYKNPGGIVVTENGCGFDQNPKKPSEHDQDRINFFKGYLGGMNEAIQDGAKVKAYFAWSFMDNFEWSFGYAKRFGLCHVDYKTQVRTPRPVAQYMTRVMEQNSLPNDGESAPDNKVQAD